MILAKKGARVSTILDGFRRLTDFSGRDRRGRFWPYALVVLALAYVGMAAVMIPLMAGVFAEATAYAAANPDQATVVSGPGYYSVQIHDPEAIAMPDFGLVFTAVGIAAALTVILLAAAVTRRLHDTSRAGWWGLPPVVFLTTGLLLFPRMMDQMMQSEAEAPSMDLFFLLFANNLIYIICLLGLIILLVLDGTKGPNRYGPPSD